jgi:protein-S-isoprenylcysteine O-methyltransferase Ste14
MRLLDHFGRSGDTFFRLRSYLPLLLLPVFVLGVRSGAGVPNGLRLGCQTVGLLVSLAGLAVRIVVIGAAPPGTSERSTRDPRASVLNTTGAYSIVRHPLYLGNTLVGLGLALFTATWYVPVIVVLASLLYHERIAVREEVFLESRFGDEFRTWANEVPALWPAFGRYRRSGGAFRWKKVLAREFHALFVIGASCFVFDVGRQVFATGRVGASPLWTAVFAVTGVVFVGLTAIKKTTGLLRVSETPDRPKP